MLFNLFRFMLGANPSPLHLFNQQREYPVNHLNGRRETERFLGMLDYQRNYYNQQETRDMSIKDRMKVGQVWMDRDFGASVKVLYLGEQECFLLCLGDKSERSVSYYDIERENWFLTHNAPGHRELKKHVACGCPRCLRLPQGEEEPKMTWVYIHAELMELSKKILEEEQGSASGERWSYEVRKLAVKYNHNPKESDHVQ